MAAPRRGRWRGRATRSTSRSSRSTATSARLAVDLKSARRQRGRCASSCERRRLPAELPPRRGCASGRRLRVAEGHQPVDRLRLDLGLRRGRPVQRPPRPGPAAAGHVAARCSSAGPARRRRRTPAGQYLVDAITASTAFEGVLAALLHRERTGEGQLVQVNMLDALTTLQMQELSVFTVGKASRRSARPSRTPTSTSARRTASSRPATATSPSPSPTWTTLGRRHRRAGLRRHGPRGRRLDPPRRDLREDRGAACARQPAEYWLETLARCRHLGRPGLRLPGPRRRPADRAQRHLRRVRPPHRGPREDAGIPVQVLARPRLGSTAAPR